MSQKDWVISHLPDGDRYGGHAEHTLPPLVTRISQSIRCPELCESLLSGPAAGRPSEGGGLFVDHITRTLSEFRPGVFARWMDTEYVDGHPWRFDGKRWRPRNTTDTGFCNDPHATPECERDRWLGSAIPPAELMTFEDLRL